MSAMKHYAVELSRTVYITIHVEARDMDEAETLAWCEIDNSNYHRDVDWELNDITEQHIPTNVKET